MASLGALGDQVNAHFNFKLAGWPAVRWRHICNQPKDSTVIFLKPFCTCAREKEKLPTLNKKFNLLYYLVIFSWYSCRIKVVICVKHKYRSGKRYCAEVEQIFKVEEGWLHVRRRCGISAEEKSSHRRETSTQTSRSRVLDCWKWLKWRLIK